MVSGILYRFKYFEKVSHILEKILLHFPLVLMNTLNKTESAVF